MIGRTSICSVLDLIENNLRAVIESKSIILPVLYELGVFGVIVLAAVTAGQYPPAKISEAAAVFRKLRREISILIIATSNKYLRNGTRDS